MIASRHRHTVTFAHEKPVAINRVGLDGGRWIHLHDSRRHDDSRPGRALVRAECREGSRVELRRRDPHGVQIDVWLECKPRLPLMKAWTMIGHVPAESAVSILALADERSTVIGLGRVKTVYAPAGRDEAVVTVEITPKSQA